MPQARDSHIPSSGQRIPQVDQTQAHAVGEKARKPHKSAGARSRGAKRRMILLVGLAGLVLGILLIWTGVSAVHARPATIASFTVTSGNQKLYVNFQLANSRGELVRAAGSGAVEFCDGSGNILARQQISFTKKDFDGSSKTCSVAIPKTALDLRNSVNRAETFPAALAKLRTALANGRAILTLVKDNGGALTAVCDGIQFYSAEEAAKIFRRIYYEDAIQVFEAEINRQWPFAVKITDYAMIGDRGWAAASRSGSEIIFYPYGKTYSFYLLQTEDGGRNWDIAWRGDSAPRFAVETTDGSTLTVTTPHRVFHINLNGEEAVRFNDSHLEAAIRAAIRVTKEPIYPSDLKGLVSLSAANSNISDLTGLEQCTSLRALHLENNQIKDISSLSRLTNLTVLTLHGNRIDDISALARLTGLTTLQLSDNHISNISPLASLANLKYLYLSENQIKDVSPLAGLTNLAILMLLDNKISDISPLVNNRGLGDGDTIGLTGNPLSETSLNTYLPSLRKRGVNVIWPVTAPSVVTGSRQEPDVDASQGPAPRPN